jgi:chemotaxis protein MotB
MKPRARSKVSHERWLVSYADFITLLFGFFVVMYAFAKADQKKQVQVVAAIDAAFRSMGMTPVSTTTNDQTPVAVINEDALSPAAVKLDFQRIQRELNSELAGQLKAHTVSIEMGRDGLIISLREAGFFASGSAMPKPEALPVLRKVAESLGRMPYDLRIEGHTDNVPIHTAQFDSNWELSTARATSIARLFLYLKAIPPERLSAAGYAEFHPMESNDTPEGRAVNRRVDIVVLPRTKINFAGMNAQPASGAWRRITDGDK